MNLFSAALTRLKGWGAEHGALLAAVDRTAIERAMPEATRDVTWVGAGTGVFGFLMSSSTIGLVGLFVAVLGLLTNVYFQRRRDKREEAARAEALAEHLKRMRRLGETTPGDLQ